MGYVQIDVLLETGVGVVDGAVVVGVVAAGFDHQLFALPICPAIPARPVPTLDNAEPIVPFAEV